MSLALLRQLKALTARLTNWHFRWLKRLALTALLLLTLGALAWQFWLVPRLTLYKPWLEQQLSQKVGAPVRIAALQGGWHGIRPQLALLRFQLLNDQQHAALEFSRMEGTLSWWHLLLGQVRFSHLQLQAPQLDIVRLQNKQWQIAGLTLSGTQKSDGQLLNWLLAQGELTISQGVLRLQDRRGEFPALSADNVQLNVRNWFSNHQAVLKFSPSQLAGSPVEINASLNGSDVNQWAQWSGWLSLNLPQADLSRAAPWLSPLLPALKVRSGLGALALKLELTEGELDGVEADLMLKQWRLSLPAQPELYLPLFNGRIVWRDRNQQRTLQLTGKQIDGAKLPLCRDCELSYVQAKGRQSVSARNWSLAGLNAYNAFFPAELAAYREARLTGTLDKLSVEWPGAWPIDPQAKPPVWSSLSIEAEVKQLGWQQLAQWPAASGFDLDLQVEPRGGRLKLVGQNAQFIYPAQFLEPMKFSRLQSELAWQREAQGWRLDLEGLKVASPELDLTAQGHYVWPGTGMGQVDLSANIDRLAANRVFAYLPRVLSDEVLVWLKTSLLAGEAQHGQLIWRGDVAQFPYTLGTPAAKAGQFTVKTRAAGVTINYGDDWPMITQVDGQVLIDGMQLIVDAKKGDITGTALDKVKVTIPNLEYQQHVLVDGRVKGKTADFLRFVQASPVQQATHGFLDHLQAQGTGELDLQLDIPIENIEKTKIKGLYAFNGNQLNFGAAIPPLSQAKGAVSFTESTMQVLPSTAKSLGGAVQLQGETNAQGLLQLAMKGQAELGQALQYYVPPLSPWLQGVVPFQASLNVSEASYAFSMSSELQGGQVLFPAPLAKTAAQTRPFRLKVAGENGIPRVDFAYGKTLQAGLLLSPDPAALRGKVLLGSDIGGVAAPLTPLLLDGKGLQIAGQWPQLNLSDWLALQDMASPSSPLGAQSLPSMTLQQLGFEQLILGDKRLTDVRVSGQVSAKGVQASLSSQQIVGDVQWQNKQLSAQLSKLHLPLKSAAQNDSGSDKKTKFTARGPLAEPQSQHGLDDWLGWPALHLVANDFRFKDIELGTLTLRSQPQSRRIDFDELSLRNADGQITLTGQWSKPNQAERTQAKVKIESPNMGKLLKRLGYPEAMKAAPLILHGDGQWQGAPWSPDWTSVNGKLDLVIGAGQFTQLEPGVGRFISILSLQALPRRLKLDFSDVFSAGFEFDEISGSATIEQGVARTNSLKINGPAAKVRFTGDANFVAGTQHLRVRIVPSISGAVALGVGVVNPLAGLATLAVQSVMDNPLGELVAYEFQIEGSMSDPQIRKIGVRPESPRVNQ